jgi:hypothetical protein
MGGLVIDYLIVYVVKASLRLMKFWGSRRWPSTVAVVKVADPLFGGRSYPTAQITYTYKVGEQSFKGRNEKPFVSLKSAESYAAHFPPGSPIQIRLNPVNPIISVIRNNDQPSLKTNW